MENVGPLHYVWCSEYSFIERHNTDSGIWVAGPYFTKKENFIPIFPFEEIWSCPTIFYFSNRVQRCIFLRPRMYVLPSQFLWKCSLFLPRRVTGSITCALKLASGRGILKGSFPRVILSLLQMYNRLTSPCPVEKVNAGFVAFWDGLWSGLVGHIQKTTSLNLA